VRYLSLHLLDIAENSVAADARWIQIEVTEDTLADRLKMSVEDDGRGMDAATAAKVIDPFVTSRTTRKVGLGIPLLKAAAEACQGSLTIQSILGQGTRIEVDFQRSNIDRMPLGDLAATFLTLVVGNPEIRWSFCYRMDAQLFEFDSAVLAQELGDLPLTEPVILTYLRETLTEGIAQVASAAQATPGLPN